MLKIVIFIYNQFKYFIQMCTKSFNSYKIYFNKKWHINKKLYDKLKSL